MSEALATGAVSDPDASQEVLVFRLGEEEYGIDILKVQEIRGYNSVTRIANAPAFIKGVTNLRGAIVPIVDLRIKFNMESVVYDAHTVVIVLNIGARIVGVVVDGVSDVLSLSPEQILPAPDFGSAVATRFLKGLATVEERMLILVDIEGMLSSAELALVDDAESAPAPA
jgi:purine-binding chemotaxis protein CheW